MNTLEILNHAIVISDDSDIRRILLENQISFPADDAKIKVLGFIAPIQGRGSYCAVFKFAGFQNSEDNGYQLFALPIELIPRAAAEIFFGNLVLKMGGNWSLKLHFRQSSANN